MKITSYITQKYDYIIQHQNNTFIFFTLLTISSLALCMRILILHYDEPLESSDAILYRYYAIEFAYNNKLADYASPLHNIGLPLVLSPIFKLLPHDIDLLLYVQKIFLMLVSITTIPLMYKLARTFGLNQYLSIITGILIGFEPRSMFVSTFGITEGLFIPLVIAGLYSSRKKHNLLAFGLAGLATIVRFEGIMILVAILFYILKTKQINFKYIQKLTIGIILFLIPIFFVIYLNLTHDAPDGFASKISHEVGFVMHTSDNEDPKPTDWLGKFANSFLYMGWSTFPMFIWFIPIGIYVLSKKKQLREVLFYCVLFGGPGIWAYLDGYDLRYFMPMFPMLAIISTLGLQKLYKRQNHSIS